MSRDDIGMMVGEYYVDDEGSVLVYEDYPTDGPLFRIAGEDGEEFEMVQVSTDDFDEDEFKQIEFEKRNSRVAAIVTLSDTIHDFEFTPFEEEDVIWPEAMIQGGETYRIGVADVPDFIIEAVEDKYGLEVEEG